MDCFFPNHIASVFDLFSSNPEPLLKASNFSKSFTTESMSRAKQEVSSVYFEYKIDLLAITDTWLNANDYAVRNESCPTNYKLCDHPSTDRIGGRTALLYRDFM